MRLDAPDKQDVMWLSAIADNKQKKKHTSPESENKKRLQRMGDRGGFSHAWQSAEMRKRSKTCPHSYHVYLTRVQAEVHAQRWRRVAGRIRRLKKDF